MLRYQKGGYHRLDRVLGFFSSRPNCGSPSPSLAGGGGGHSRLREREWGVPIRRGVRHCGTLGIYVLCGDMVKVSTVQTTAKMAWPSLTIFEAGTGSVLEFWEQSMGARIWLSDGPVRT
jgi:hypothetical protein